MKIYAAAWIVLLASCANADQDPAADNGSAAPTIAQGVAQMADGTANPSLKWRGPRRLEYAKGPVMVMVADQHARDPKGYLRLMTVQGVEGHVVSLVRADCAAQDDAYRVIRQYTAKTTIDRHVETRGGTLAITPEDAKAILCADRSRGTVTVGRADSAEEKARRYGKAKAR